MQGVFAVLLKNAHANSAPGNISTRAGKQNKVHCEEAVSGDLGLNSKMSVLESVTSIPNSCQQLYSQLLPSGGHRG